MGVDYQSMVLADASVFPDVLKLGIHIREPCLPCCKETYDVLLAGVVHIRHGI